MALLNNGILDSMAYVLYNNETHTHKYKKTQLPVSIFFNWANKNCADHLFNLLNINGTSDIFIENLVQMLKKTEN